MTNLQRKISKILYKDWSPIGMGMPKDEYDSYVPVCEFILTSNMKSKKSQLISYLYGVQNYHIGVGDGSIRHVQSKDGPFLTSEASPAIMKTVKNLMKLVKK